MLTVAAIAHAQEGGDQAQLRIVNVDISTFPTVRVSAFLNDGQHRPLEDLSTLSLRENNIPLLYELVNTPVGIDVTFIIDANGQYGEVSVDANGRSRQQKVRDSIVRYAEQFMNPDGLDRVSVIVPDGTEARYLIQDATYPADLIAAIDSYLPAGQSTVPLNSMIEMAIMSAPLRSDNTRFQAALLFTDARQMGISLDYGTLTEQAIAWDMPLNVAILGEAVDDTEQANANGLTEPTGAISTHMPTGAEMETLYQSWEAQGNRPQLVYESVQRENGRYPISINIGEARAAAEYELALQPATIAIESAGDVHRVGAAYNTLLPDLQPPTSTVSIIISWPDGIQRTIAAATLYADDSPVITFNDLPAADRIPFDLDIAFWDDRTVQLRATMIDAVDMEAESATVPLNITTERPVLTLPTPAPTVAPIVEEEPPAPPIDLRGGIAWGLMALAVVLVLMLYHFRRKRQGGDGDVVDKTAVSPPSPPPAPPPPAFLNDIALTQANVTIGSGADVVLVVEDGSVAPLHARIRRRNGRYYLYDEGSPVGTFRNYEKLGMAPHLLEEGDIIQMGKQTFAFSEKPT
jgi:hypothetical protein